MSCEPNDLIRSAQCILQCIPPGAQLPAQTAMLDLINGGPTPTNTLIQDAKEFIFRVPPRMQVPLQIYLLLVSLEGTNRTVDELLRSASCMRCIPRGFIPPVQTNEYCQWSEGGTTGCNNPVVLDWLQRMADNGVTLPSQETITAVCDFCDGLDNSGMMDKMLVVNPVIPDSLSSMRYPLIYQIGNGVSPWLNNGFAAIDLNEAGLVGDGISKYMDTGFIPDQYFLDASDGGLSFYESESDLDIVNSHRELGCSIPLNTEYMEITSWDPFAPASAVALCGDQFSIISVATNDIPAFYCSTRTSNTLFRLYRISGSISLTLVGSQNASQVGKTMPGSNMFFMAYNEFPTGAIDFSGKRVSFASVNKGLTDDEVRELFNLVQTLRMQLGGGWV